MEIEETALIEGISLDVSKLWTKPGMYDLLTKVRARAMEFEPDITTDKGRKEIASMAHKVARTKTLIDTLGKDTVAEWKKKAKAIDEYRKQARDYLDDLKAEVRKPLTDYEKEQERIRQEKIEAEELRVAGIRAAISGIREIANFIPSSSSEELQKRLQELQALKITEDRFQEFKDEAEAEQTKSLNVLADALDKVLKWEEEQKNAKEEAARLAEERRTQEEEVRKLREQQEAIEDEKQKLREERERLEREEFERKARKEARIKAEQEAKERAEREAREKAEREARQAAQKARREALLPDKQKVWNYFDRLLEIPEPEVSEDVYSLLKFFAGELAELMNKVRIELEEL